MKRSCATEQTDSEFIIYGYIPLMLSAQCVRKNTFQCDRKEAHMVLKDRYDKEFPCACVCYPWKTGTTDQKEFCYNIIYNSIPYGLLNESQKVKELKTASLRLSFTLESAKETKEIVREFLDVYVYGKKLLPVSLQRDILKEEPNKAYD